jgi:asparagine synthase (glutamine-hydrolysing)
MRLPRYLAVAGPRDPFGEKQLIRRAMDAAGLGLAYAGPELEVYCDTRGWPCLADGAGVVLGPIFRQQGAMAPVTAFSAEESRRIVQSRGQALIEDCWGDYLAFIVAPGRALVVRPPFSDLTSFHAAQRGLVLVASGLELLASCGVPTNEPVWSKLAAHMRYGGLRAAATCVAGIDEILWGHRLVVTGTAARTEPCWSPWRFALAPRSGSRAALAEDLRERTLTCVTAQVRHLDSVVAMLSGGLDSSILAACLAQAGPRLHCLNLAYGGAIGDERIYARAVAAHLGVPLTEIAPDLHDVDVTRCNTADLARPIARAFLQPSRRAKYRIAAATQAADVVDGGGGDSLFCFLQSVAPVADRLRREGPGRGMIETAGDVARLTGASMVEVLLRTLRRTFLRSPAHRWSLTDRFLRGRAIDLAGRRSHAWLQTPRGALPGSASHIANMVVVENLIDIGNGTVAEWSPLMAQPLVEFCLSVPSWYWVENGHNRALARRAFAPLLPPEIAWRRGKGTPDGFAAAIFETCREALAQFLIGGRLDAAGLLDTPTLRAALAPGRPVKGHDYNRVLRIADVEAWVRSCEDRQPTPLQAPSPRLPGGAQSLTMLPGSTDPEGA